MSSTGTFINKERKYTPRIKTFALKANQPFFIGEILERTNIRSNEKYYTVEILSSPDEKYAMRFPCVENVGERLLKMESEQVELLFEFRDYTFVKKGSKGCTLGIVGIADKE